jgi:hypothetical protein
VNRTEVLNNEDVHGTVLLKYVSPHEGAKYYFSEEFGKGYLMVVTCQCGVVTSFHASGYAYYFVSNKHRLTEPASSLWKLCRGCGVQLLQPIKHTMPEVDPDGGEYIGE